MKTVWSRGAVLFATRYRPTRKHQILLTFAPRVTVFFHCSVLSDILGNLFILAGIVIQRMSLY